MSRLLPKFNWLLRRHSKEDELRQELEFHLDEETELRREEGLASEQARWAARRDLGNVALVRENTRAVWTWRFLEQLLQDLRYAFRAMRHNKAFTALAAVSLALGIGANTAIYSFLDTILLRSLPVSDPSSLVVINWKSKLPERNANREPIFVMHSVSGSSYSDKEGQISGIFPYPAFELLRTHNAVFTTLFAYFPAPSRTVMVHGHSERSNGEFVSGDYFRGLAVAPAAGRLIGSDDDLAGAPPVVVLNFGVSQRRFGSPANAVGQTVLIDNKPFIVIGVTPPEFFGVDPASAPDFYLPAHSILVLDAGRTWGETEESFLDKNYYWIEMMARLRPGVGIAQAQASLEPLFHNWVASTAENDRERANLPRLVIREGAGGLDTLRHEYSRPLYVLLAMVGLILLIACANSANLLLARAAARKREMAVRLSLGAGRWRVMRQLLTESVVLASLGGALGVFFAVWGIRFLTVLLANGDERYTLRAELNWHVLAATFALSVLCGVLFGMAPAIQSTKADVMPALKEVREGKPRRRFFRLNLGHALVVAQIAISLLLLVGAGLFVRTLSNLESVQLGFNRENLLLFELNARQAGHRDPEIGAFYGNLRRRFKEIPGVRAASLSHLSIIRAGRQLPISIKGVFARGTRVLNCGPEFFATMQIPILAGRDVEDRDGPGSPGVVFVNERFARLHFGSNNPIGQYVTLGGETPRDMEIAGLSADARYGDLKREIPPVVYIPYNQGTTPPIDQMVYELRTAGDPLFYVKAVGDIVHQADPRIPVTGIKTQAVEIDQSINQEIIFAKLCTGFAILALVIACVGLYGTMSYKMERRTGEIGIRMALGAQRAGVVRMVLREVTVLAVVGLAIGLPVAAAMSKLVKSFLYGLKPNDPLAIAVAAFIMVAAVILAGYGPARRASRIDPMIALRHE